MVTKREQMPTDRQETPARNQLNAPFKFMVRPFSTVGVESLDLATWFEDEILEIMYEEKFHSKINGIIVFPKIFDTDVAAPPNDHLTCKKGEKYIFVGLSIGFLTWNSSSKQEKFNILAENIRKSIQSIPSKYLTEIDRDKLISALERAHERLIQRIVH